MLVSKVGYRIRIIVFFILMNIVISLRLMVGRFSLIVFLIRLVKINIVIGI